MRIVTGWSVLCVLCVVCVGIFAGIGCDTVGSSEDVITMDPPVSTVKGEDDLIITVMDTNATLFLPLKWSVSEPDLGSVSQQGALTAIYRGNDAEGVNTVMVWDQGDAQGTVIIYQETE